MRSTKSRVLVTGAAGWTAVAINVRGTYNLFEAAQRHGVERIVLMSSAAVHLPAATPDTIASTETWTSSSSNDHLYDLTKRLQEEIARDFCETFGMRAVVLRAGHIVDGRAGVDPKGRDLAMLTYCRGGWVCRYDVAKACLGALTAKVPGCAIYNVVGAVVARARFDIDRTERELGMRFEQQFEAYV